MNVFRLAGGVMVALFVCAAMALFSHLDAYNRGLVIGLLFGMAAPALGVLLARLARRDEAAEQARQPVAPVAAVVPTAPALLPDGWEYQTIVTRTVDASGLVCEERFTLLVPKGRSIISLQQPKQLTGGDTWNA